MSELLVTPILFQYQFLDDLCAKAANILAINSLEPDRYKQLKLSVFINFNRYLTESILFLPNNEAEDLLAKLAISIKDGDENKTLDILRTDLDFFDELVGDFLNIIKTLKK